VRGVHEVVRYISDSIAATTAQHTVRCGSLDSSITIADFSVYGCPYLILASFFSVVV
jgi:hypothetical protein